MEVASSTRTTPCSFCGASRVYRGGQLVRSTEALGPSVGVFSTPAQAPVRLGRASIIGPQVSPHGRFSGITSHIDGEVGDAPALSSQGEVTVACARNGASRGGLSGIAVSISCRAIEAEDGAKGGGRRVCRPASKAATGGGKARGEGRPSAFVRA